tara:strand:- start:134 stop:484 length:351 start_codon:yes stop_codon:yes gene_type:complete
MGNTTSSFVELQEKYDNMTGTVKVLQHENKKLKHKMDTLNRDNYGLMEDIKMEKIKRIHIEKSISDLLETSLCDEYLLSNNNIVLDDAFERKLLYKFINYTKNKWVDNMNKHHKVD